MVRTNLKNNLFFTKQMNFWTKFSKKLFFLFNEQFYRMNNFTEIFMSDEKKTNDE